MYTASSCPNAPASATQDIGDCAPALLLWFFDSRGGNYYQEVDNEGMAVPQPCWVDESVAVWSSSTLKFAQTYSKTIPSLAFVHILVEASQALQLEKGVSPKYQPGVNDDNPLASQA